jgi:putative transcriptional regulator
MKNRVKVGRAEFDISQAELAKLVGVSRQTINSIESNRYAPSVVLALKIARKLNMAVEELFKLSELD